MISTSQTRLRLGIHRARSSFVPILLASLAAGVAYLIGRYALGHEAPFFASFAAWACLGFSFDRELRRVGEIAAGVAMGVGIGDVVVRLIGTGWWQLTTVLFVAAITARIVDRGPLLAAQAGAQAIVIVGMPTLTGGPWGRAIDALVGGAVALVVAVLTPHDARRSVRRHTAAAAGELASFARTLAFALTTSDARGYETALAQGRASEAAHVDAIERAHAAAEQSRNTVNRRHLADLQHLERQAILVDRAHRSVRVLARRASTDLTITDVKDRQLLGMTVDHLSYATRLLADSIKDGTSPQIARVELTALAQSLQPGFVTDLGARTGILLLRPAASDLLEATGLSSDDAAARLPDA